ncbi:MAG: right-handed parallel beta-helix repeat-containing protein [Thermoanaerobaculia bacterium]
MRRLTKGISSLFPVLLFLFVASSCTSSRPGSPAVDSQPGAVQNPPDVGAAIPHPEPPQPEHEILPPQQSEEEEKKTANPHGEPRLIDVMPTVFLDGEPFPNARHYDAAFPDPRRTFYVSVESPAGGDGSEKRPWKDLQFALTRLQPGDRLVVIPGIYEGPFTIGKDCRDGTKEAPIQVYADDAFLKSSSGADVLTVERPFWQFWEVQIALLHSRGSGFVTKGPAAHDIAVDQSHIYEGEGPAVRFEAGSSRITLSSCHIHQGRGVEIDTGTRDITIVADHIHHNSGTSLTIGAGDVSREPAENISVLGNRFHNDRGHAVELRRCRHVRLSENKISNYRPEGSFAGDAVVVAAGSSDVAFENNTILEATRAISVGGNSSESGPDRVAFRRNYLENQLTRQSTALLVRGGREIHFENNIVDRYEEPFDVGSAGVSEVSIANNLVIRPAFAWDVASFGVFNLFDFNVFGGESTLQGSVGGRASRAADWIGRRMPHSRLVPGAEISGRDLGKIVGFSALDAGTAVKGLSFKGLAPDIGIAEH